LKAKLNTVFGVERETGSIASIDVLCPEELTGTENDDAKGCLPLSLPELLISRYF
jgi:hypothetical protein